MTRIHQEAQRYSQYLAGRFVDLTVAPLLPPAAANLLQMRMQNWNRYFDRSEAEFERQWKEIIWPLIEGFDFDTVLELSPGAGRNTEKLSTLSRRLIAVDISQSALDQTKSRLAALRPYCDISYHRNNGSSLAMISDSAVTAVYCWDSAVHFDRGVLSAYVREFARILKPGGAGFLHHSALGEHAHGNIKRNPHWRSNASAELVARSCAQSGLVVSRQQPVPWPPIVDCATVFYKPA